MCILARHTTGKGSKHDCKHSWNLSITKHSLFFQHFNIGISTSVSCSNLSSLPLGPIRLNPTGHPSTFAMGKLTCRQLNCSSLTCISKGHDTHVTVSCTVFAVRKVLCGHDLRCLTHSAISRPLCLPYSQCDSPSHMAVAAFAWKTDVSRQL